jgi:hypothetical protein
MKKIIFIVLFLLGFIAFTITQATAGCNIVWTGYVSGSTPTQETSRTHQAIQEAFKAIFGTECSFQEYQNDLLGIYISSECCSSILLLSGGPLIKQVGPAGDYSDIRYSINCPDQLCYANSGVWNVECETTLIQISGFSVTPGLGKVTIEWSTESETDNAGFNIYRSESADGDYIKINTSLIPANGSSIQGASYEFADTDVQNRKTYYYKLKDIDLNGTSTMHGPVSATPRLIYGLKK